MEEGQPEFIEQAVNQFFRQLDVQTQVVGKGPLPMAGEYTGDVMKSGVQAFVQKWSARAGVKQAAEQPLLPASQLGLSKRLPVRPSGLCTGCPERPLFASMKLGSERGGTGACKRGYRLPLFLDHASLQYGWKHHGLRIGAGRGGRTQRRASQTTSVVNGGWRVLAQRAD